MADDCRAARIGAGLSLRFVARALGVSHARVGRFERGDVADPSLSFVGAYCTVVGLDLAMRTYPAGDALRDGAQLALLGRLRRLLHPALRWVDEVPLDRPGDLRAWDAVIRGPGWQACVEAETRVHDLQALERRLALKCRDGSATLLILLLRDTERTRDVLRVHRESLRGLLPLDARPILAALREGRAPPHGGIVVL